MKGINENQIRKTKFGIEFDYNISNKEYTVQIVYPSSNSNYNIPYILVLPKEIKNNCLLAVEVNNLETENKDKLIKSGLRTAHDLTNILREHNNPILVPIIPSVESKIPYYQQLSKECFSIFDNNPFYRIDLQVKNIIEEVKNKISKTVKIEDKIFLNGYSSSGVFAQRFALLHPEIVEVLCVGGASGSIPIPTKELDYPLGIKNYNNITGKHFDFDSYSQIKFRYYVGSLEDKRKTKERYDEFGNPAPMHDMSYFNRSIPQEIGKKQRKMFGINIFERSNNQILLMNSIGIDIKQQIFQGRTHNNYNGTGVNELRDIFVDEIYKESINKNKTL